MFVADASTFNGNTATGGSGTPTVNMQMFLANSNSTMTIGSLGNFVLRPHANDAVLGTSSRGWNTIYTQNLYSTSGDLQLKSGVSSASGVTFGDGSTGGIITIGTENSSQSTSGLSEGGKIYAKTDSKLYFRAHGDGTEYDLTGGGGGGSTALDDITAGDAESTLATTAGNIIIDAQGTDTDVIIKVDDADTSVDAVTFDGSNAGTASFNNRVRAADGSASSPTFSFTGDTDTGMYKYAANAPGFSTQGSLVAYFDDDYFYVKDGLVAIDDTNTFINWGVDSTFGLADSIYFVTGGTTNTVHYNGYVFAAEGFIPSLTDTDTYVDNGGANVLRIIAGNATAAEFTNDGSDNMEVGIAGIHSNSYNLIVRGSAAKTAGGTTWVDASDDRIKTDVLSLTGATETLKKLNPISFKYTDEWRTATKNKSHTMHGFLASDYENTFPDFTDVTDLKLVKTADDTYKTKSKSEEVGDDETIMYEDVKFIDTTSLVPHLVASIKELEDRITKLEGE
tara:strand:- start:1358 stop:2881 length:1524 start_codon:yes stop_codon:yes gene_type:complete